MEVGVALLLKIPVFCLYQSPKSESLPNTFGYHPMWIEKPLLPGENRLDAIEDTIDHFDIIWPQLTYEDERLEDSKEQ
jgi:hypothetical protein